MKPNDIAKSLKYLRDAGLSERQLSMLHHLERPESYKRSIEYFLGVSFVRGNNEKYGRRLHYIVENHKRGRVNFSELIKEALQRWPLGT